MSLPKVRWQPQVMSFRDIVRGFELVFKREAALMLASKGDLLNPLMFFLMGMALLPLSLNTQVIPLGAIAPGMIWILALLAFMLSSDGWFRADFEQGFLSHWLLSPYPIFLLVLAKVLVHWLFVATTLILALPWVAIAMQLPLSGLLWVAFLLLVGTLAMSWACAFGAALTLGLRQSGVLLVIISLPLNVPVLIFGVQTSLAYLNQQDFLGGVWVLCAMTIAWLTLMPFVIGAAVRASVE